MHRLGVGVGPWHVGLRRVVGQRVGMLHPFGGVGLVGTWGVRVGATWA